MSLAAPIIAFCYAVILIPDPWSSGFYGPLLVLPRILIVVVGSLVGAILALFSRKYRTGLSFAIGLIPNLASPVIAVLAFQIIPVHNERADEDKREPKIWGNAGHIADFAIQPDGKILIVGGGVARLNADGSQDSSFSNASDRQNGVLGIGFQPEFFDPVSVTPFPDGSALVFTENLVSKLDSNGHLVKSFDPAIVGCCLAAALQSGGRILFATLAPEPTNSSLQRLLKNERPDSTFHSAIRYDSTIRFLSIVDGDKILVGGDIRFDVDVRSDVEVEIHIERKPTPPDPVPAYPLVRLNSDGTFDPTFRLRADERGGARVFSQLRDRSLVIGVWNREDATELVQMDRDGRPLVTSALTNLHLARIQSIVDDGRFVIGYLNGIDRYLPNGSPDLTFHPAAIHEITKIQQQGDKYLVLTGNEQRLFRLSQDGSLDSTFDLPALRINRK